MDDDYSNTGSIANRGEAIPVIRFPRADDEVPETSNTTTSWPSSGEAGGSKKPRKRDVWRQEAEKLRGKLHDANAHYKASHASVQERLVNSLLEQVFPNEVDEDGHPKKDRRSRQYVDRPNFSLPMMSSNFRRFNARIGIVFVFQNELIRLFTWVVPSHTLSFLAVYTLVCLQPNLIPIVPLAAVLFFVMVPSFLARHPPPPSAKPPSSNAAAAEQYANYGYSGPAVAPPQRVKPAPEMSKDFFRNMRDLQNCMEDFSRAHDAAIALVTPFTDFSDEPLSSTVFLAVTLVCSAAFIASHLIPWRAVALVTGWLATGAGHPEAQELLLSASSLEQFKLWREQASARLREWTIKDIVLDEPPEIREVEIFELQKRRNSYQGLTSSKKDNEWEPWLFTTSPYDPMSPSRIAGARAVGTQFFEEVQAPPGWRWRDKKWMLDLYSREWVEERCVTGVEVETEGEHWVYDITYPDTAPGAYAFGSPLNSSFKSSKGKHATSKSLDEGAGVGKRGDWRRRRWVRLVERKVVKVSLDS
ncbi:hypothetical protein AAFC00_004801 [Neodothiora populina]|uniref:TECPR1-like DysF domain-containing protein n=1 Tax=Neodothiora populina TaxID=2781224 RepID=A0ABR3P3N5_9PEZI